MKVLLISLIFITFLAPAQQADVAVNKEILRIAFGSCSKQDQPESQLWAEVNKTNPDLWVWLGDNIYGDTEDMDVMKAKYDQQKSHTGYKTLLSRSSVIGIWDDHDFGVNDGGAEYPMKDQSRDLLFDFLNVDKNNPARKRQGAYQSYTYNNSQGNIKVILLDARYFRDSLKWENPGTDDKIALKNETGDILGETQWKWLENQLSDNEIDLFILASGIQVIPEEHRWEKWSNFPMAKERLLNTIKKIDTPLIIISGDRHLSEVSKLDLEGYDYPLYELTSSSLNSPSTISEENNRFRLKNKIHERNFATMTIIWIAGKPSIQLKYIGKGGKSLASHQIQFN
ncbi:alkaline phosphatase D [Ekhidna lutea]|uniref:Alkaline phosphatase D n=1 Tax=Ekhidna lutea TaxID=447679 RepID=A0A239L907_EKHLU|nr:alkaline phosphatase D family protein [Ekhidna lutea]SNT26951.1 alkaline phosphatase D [Ekhidna lutea]